MKQALIIFIFSGLGFCYGQSNYLVPIDSFNYKFVNGSLVDEYQIIPDSLWSLDSKWNKENVIKRAKECSCIDTSVVGKVSFEVKSLWHPRNMCFFIFTIEGHYFIRTGRVHDNSIFPKNYPLNYKTKALNKGKAEKVIDEIAYRIGESQVARYDAEYIVYGETSFYFGNIETNEFTTTPYFYTEEIRKLVRMSVKLLKRKHGHFKKNN